VTIIMLAIALAIGVSLGLLGAGGAIVAVPAFVYIGGVPSHLADGYALFVVAVASAIAVAIQWRERMIEWRTIAWLLLPSPCCASARLQVLTQVRCSPFD